MGLKTYDGLSSDFSKFIYLSKGKVIQYVNKVRTEHDSVEGFVQCIDIEVAEYNKKEYDKVVLYMLDDENTEMILCFPLQSGYGSCFSKLVKNVDWKKPLEISVKQEAVGSKSYAKLFIKQPGADGKWVNLKWAYTEAIPEKMPPGEKRSDRNGDYTDYTKRNAFFKKLLTELVYKAIRKAWPDFDLAKAKDTKKITPRQTGADVTEPIDDLPF